MKKATLWWPLTKQFHYARTCSVSKDILKVYVTGLTAAVAELIAVCAENGISLTLMHYDRENESYVPQYVTTWW